MRCEYCHNITEYLARVANNNKNITNNDIYKIISLYSENPTTVQYYDYCKLRTLQTRIAWKGTT